jgi:hypothetical protein
MSAVPRITPPRGPPCPKVLEPLFESDGSGIGAIDAIAGQIDGAGDETSRFKIGRETGPGPRSLPGAVDQNDGIEVGRPCAGPF